jgi:hypothetical protein
MFGFDTRDSRDPERHHRILQLLDEVWRRQYPQLRFGQLLANVEHGLERNLFSFEDDKLEAALKKVIEKGFFSP